MNRTVELRSEEKHAVSLVAVVASRDSNRKFTEARILWTTLVSFGQKKVQCMRLNSMFVRIVLMLVMRW